MRMFAGRQRIAGFIAGILAFSLLGGGAAWAYWTTSAQGSGTIQTRTVSITQTNFANLSDIYRNHKPTSTGSFTVTNTGATDGVVTISIATSPAGLAADLPIRVWPVANAAACTATTTMPNSASTGTWASYSLGTGTALAAGASVTYCVRTIAVSRQSVATASAGGVRTSTATLTATLDDDDGWDGTRTATATATQATELIYLAPVAGSPNYISPGNSNWFLVKRTATLTQCLDVSNSGSGGTSAIAWSCHAGPNQRWEFLPVSAASAPGGGTNFVRIRPKHAAGLGLRLAVNGSNQVVAVTEDTTSTAQLWEFQRITETTFQLISHNSGFCLNMGDTALDVALTVSACATTTAARANQILTLTREPLTLNVSGGGGTGGNVTFGFSGAETSTAQYRIQILSGGNWSNRGSASGTEASSVSMPRSDVPTGTSTWRIVIEGTSTVIYSGITLNRSVNTVTATAGIG